MILEELLNKLIKRGWIPFDVKWVSEYFFESVPVGQYRLCWKKPDYDYNVYSKRELVSIESWLWQFVCENKLYKDYVEDRWTYWDSMTKCCNYRDYEYRVLESALCDEDKLEEFLLDNIKIWWQ